LFSPITSVKLETERNVAEKVISSASLGFPWQVINIDINIWIANPKVKQTDSLAMLQKQNTLELLQLYHKLSFFY